ncbi:hypothetical protein BVF91_12000 [Thermoanaerobacterium sp. PSU-2]|uniref:phage tail protein n=1 Tax=Thermoanaerobacterium sp. PSU-2 TaxID=1930849 RepID=UPI000A1628D3|nr:hypothetical protein [Thermoanaerobacterium sp. PSU-2]ORX22388.1 hypothetical protein BVF91_12000 [Thermoanaerobacterium sp. PSU-2]
MAAGNENDIGGKVSLDITDFKANIAELNRQIRVIDTGFKAAAAGMDDWGSNAEGLQARIKALNEITELQRQKVEALTNEYKRIAAEKGEDSKAAQDLQIRINKETESLNKNQKELADCTAKLNSFGNEMEQESSKASKFDGVLSKLGDGLGKIGATIGKAAIAGIAAVGTAAVGAATGVWKMATSAADYADEIQKASDVTGLTAERVQELRYAGDNLGVSFDTIAGAQAKLTKSMAAAKDGTGAQAAAFKALGISVTDSNGQLRDSKIVFSEALNALNGISNETERDALAMQIFGKSAMELNPLIKAGGDELNRLTQEAEKNGAVLSGEQISALDAFGDSISALKMSLQGLGGNIASAVLPALQSLVNNVQNVTAAVGQALKTGDWSQVGTAISEGLNSIINQILGFLPQILTVIPTILTGIANAIVTAIPTVLPPLIDATMQLLNSLIQVISSSGPQLIEAAVQAITMLVTGISQALPNLIQAAVGIVMALINGITQALPQLVPVALQIILALVNGIIPALPKLIEAALQMILALVKGLMKALPKLVDAIPKIIESFYDAIYSNLSTIIDLGTEILTALINGIIDTIPALVAALPKVIDAILKTILTNLPKIIESGIQLLQALINGLARAIPQLISYIPTIVTTIVSVIIQNLPMLISAALQIMVALALGIVQNIPEVVAVIPQIFIAMVKGFAKINWAQLGIDLIRGIANGVADAAVSLAEGVVRAAKNALNAAKNALGIHSPSRLFRDEVGLQIGAGMAEGIADSSKMVNKAMQGLNEQVNSDISTNLSTNVNTGINYRELASALKDILFPQMQFGSLITVENLVVRNDSDIYNISRQLNNLIQSSNRARGVR